MAVNPRWQNSRWLPSSSWVRMNEWSLFCAKWLNPRWQIQDGCHHQVEWKWRSLSQRFESRVLFKMAESKMAEFKMAAIIKLSQNEWVKYFVQMVKREEWVKFFFGNGGNQSWQVWVSLRENTKMAESKMVKFKLAEFKMAAIIKLGENEWVWVRLN